MSRLAVLAVATAVLSSGCRFSDEDCSDDECHLVCTRDGACLPQDEVRRVQIVWLIRGQGATATSCEGIAEIEIRFLDRDGGDPHRYTQVPCALGLFTVDRLSARFDEVEVTGLGDGGRELVRGSAAIEGADATPQVDLIGR